jgi:hypothetical protein
VGPADKYGGATLGKAKAKAKKKKGVRGQRHAYKSEEGRRASRPLLKTPSPSCSHHAATTARPPPLLSQPPARVAHLLPAPTATTRRYRHPHVQGRRSIGSSRSLLGPS